MFKKFLLLFLFVGTSNLLYSQITISSPVVRQIFQRDLKNQALVTITGSYSLPMDTIQVRLTPVKTGQGTLVDWTVIKSSPLGGLFKGAVSVKGGWYTMEVRGLLNGQVVGNISKIDRVGVGEVFVIAGQSNAGGSGLLETNETAATDDRVNCANFISPGTYYSSYPFFHAELSQFSIVEFSQLKKTSAIGPTGLGPYYWGKVGDALTAKLNVPIMFFNTGWAGASVRVWRESAENPTLGVPSDFQFDSNNINRYQVGYPYANLNAVLRYYGINMGVRAVLWMEGETQNLLNLSAARNNKPLPVTLASYLDNLQRLVKKTRQDLGNNKLAWVVARASYSGDLDCKNPNTPPPSPSPIIVNAQNQAIADPTLAPMYPGPFTDNIQVAQLRERDQCVHFTGTGLNDAAAAWVKSLCEDNKNFFDTVEPIVADTIPSVTLDCISSGVLKLSLPDGYAAYEWVNTDNSVVVGKTKSVNVGTGSYTARVTRSNGNLIQVPKFTVKANTPPQAPIVTASSDVNFCLGTSVILKSTTQAESPIYQWTSTPVISNLPSTKDIAASREGIYKLRVIDKNACASPYSTEIQLIAKPRPETPTIATSGSTEFCDGQSIVLTSSNVGASSYLWSTGDNTQTITVKKGGSYSVQSRGANSCLSQSSKDNIFVVVNPLPSSPQIKALADTVFCDGGSVSLVSTPSDNSTRFGWNKNNNVNNADNVATIKISGTELVRGFVIDSKNCSSQLSNAIQVVKKDNPKVISIFQKGTYTLAARSEKPADEYTWKLEGKALATSPKDTVIRASDIGKYSVIGKNVYKVRSSTTPLTCISTESSYDLVTYDDKGLSIYPNPSNGIFTLESRYGLEKVTITVYSLAGQLLYEGKLEALNSQRTIDLSALPESFYILRVDATNFKISKLISVIR
jgi:Secretion system C-terminal sorting domain/Carbohydrate esterase, sialic acid-specific acetylesterase